MSTADSDQTPLDPDSGLPREPDLTGDDETLDPIGESLRDGVADGDVLTDPDLPLDDAPDGAAGPA